MAARAKALDLTGSAFSSTMGVAAAPFASLAAADRRDRVVAISYARVAAAALVQTNEARASAARES